MSELGRTARTRARPRHRRLAAPASLLALACGCASEDRWSSRSPDEVVAIDWTSFQAPPPADENAVRMRAILLGANRYALTTWYASMGFDRQPGEQLDLGKMDEDHIRPVASEAFALAVSLRLGVYDEAAVGVPEEVAEERTVRLIGSLAASHLGQRDHGWGGDWQSALWAAYAGTAGWLLWDRLAPADAERVAAMVRDEADQLVGYQVPYFRDGTDVVRHTGDSKAEENAWNAQVLYLAVNMMPDAPQASAWEYKAAELAVSSYARPADLRAGERVNGRSHAQWLHGSNANPDGTVVNHDIVHPDYIATAAYTATAPLWYGMRRRPTPEAMFEGVARAYAALSEVSWAPGDSYADTSCLSTPCRCGKLLRCAAVDPGGPIYVPGSPEVYFPHGTDWGLGRRMNFAMFDAVADSFELDSETSVSARSWEALHAGAVLARQLESSDRRAYLTDVEDTYAGREPWVAVHAAMAWFAKYVVANRAYARTGRAIVVVIDDRDAEFEILGGDWKSSAPGAQLGRAARVASADQARAGARARWLPALSEGTYTVRAWWSADAANTARATYEVKHAGGVTRVTVDQRAAGGWVALGSYRLASGAEVILSGADADGALVADAVEFAPGSDAVDRG